MSTTTGNGTNWDNVFSYHPMPVDLASADGVFLFDTQGERYFDASGGPFAVSMGHGHPRLTKAIADLPPEQIDKLAQAAGLMVAITDPPP